MREEFLLALHLARRRLNINEQTIAHFCKYPEKVYQILLARNENNEVYLEKAIQLIDKKVPYIGIWDQRYPELLKRITNPPLVLFYQGNFELMQSARIAIVGTRRPSPLAIVWTSNLVQYLNSVVVVSGLASGIDAIAMRIAKRSIGVLAHGFNYQYPKSSTDLYFRARANQKNHLLISEHPPYQKLQKYHLVSRNRIIAGLCSSLIIAQADTGSGALHSVNFSIEADRDVYAFDHPLLKGNAGNRSIIEAGCPKATGLLPIKVYSRFTRNAVQINAGVFAQFDDQTLQANLQAGLLDLAEIR